MAEENKKVQVVFPPNKVRKAIRRSAPASGTEQARRQHAAAQRTLEAQGKTAVDPSLINSELTSAGHAGRHPDEPIKPRGQTARKTDARARAGIRGKQDIHTQPIDPAGLGGPTDTVVTDPKGSSPAAGGQPVKSHAEIAAEAATSARKSRRKSRSKARKSAAKSADK